MPIVPEIGPLRHADTVFGADAAPKLRHEFVDGLGQPSSAGTKIFRIRADRLRDVVVQIAVADMSENDRPSSRLQPVDELRTGLQEVRQAPHQHRDVVL